MIAIDDVLLEEPSRNLGLYVSQSAHGSLWIETTGNVNNIKIHLEQKIIWSLEQKTIAASPLLAAHALQVHGEAHDYRYNLGCSSLQSLLLKHPRTPQPDGIIVQLACKSSFSLVNSDDIVASAENFSISSSSFGT